jgi:hypothetical protein
LRLLDFFAIRGCGGLFATTFTARSKRAHASGSNSTIGLADFDMDYPTIKIKKLDAARRQLRTAIRLWFTAGDPVSIHTLASASHEIIHTLFRRKGLHGLMFDTDQIKDKHRGDWAKLFKDSASFFKHANRENESEIEFNTGSNMAVIIAGVHGLHRMGEPKELEDSAFMYWLRIQHPNFFVKDKVRDGDGVDPFEKIRNVDKTEFFEAFELVWRPSEPMPLPRRIFPR